MRRGAAPSSTGRGRHTSHRRHGAGFAKKCLNAFTAFKTSMLILWWRGSAIEQLEYLRSPLILMPKGARVIQILQRFVEDEEQKRGYLLTKTPFFAKRELYKISGHWDHYREGMFIMGDPESEDEVFALRPMTCPFQFQAYLSRMRSYRDLPLRYNETSTLFRNEASGEMHGLIRLRQFTISEGHIACTPEQLEKEFFDALDLARFMLKPTSLPVSKRREIMSSSLYA